MHTLGRPDVHAWDLPETLDPARVNIGRYITLLVRAAHSVLEPFGISEPYLKAQVLDQPSRQISLPPAPRPHRKLRTAYRYVFLPEENR